MFIVIVSSVTLSIFFQSNMYFKNPTKPPYIKPTSTPKIYSKFSNPFFSNKVFLFILSLHLYYYTLNFLLVKNCCFYFLSIFLYFTQKLCKTVIFPAFHPRLLFIFIGTFTKTIISKLMILRGYTHILNNNFV